MTLNCRNCKNLFDKDERQPFIYKQCGHTYFKSCTKPYSQSFSSYYAANDCFACFPNTNQRNANNTFFNPNANPLPCNAVILNKILLDYLDERKIYEFSETHFVFFSNSLKIIETTCSIHKDPVIGYYFKSFEFVCKKCKTQNEDIITIKDIINLRLFEIRKEKANERRVSEILEELENIQAIYNNLKDKFTLKEVITKLTESVALILIRGKPEVTNKILSIIKTHLAQYTINIDYITTIIKKIKSIVIQRKEALDNNRKNCERITNLNYALNEVFELEISFDRITNFEAITKLNEKLVKKNKFLDYEVKVTLNTCLDEVLKEKGIEKYASELQDIFSKEYYSLFKKE